MYVCLKVTLYFLSLTNKCVKIILSLLSPILTSWLWRTFLGCVCQSFDSRSIPQLCVYAIWACVSFFVVCLWLNKQSAWQLLTWGRMHLSETPGVIPQPCVCAIVSAYRSLFVTKYTISLTVKGHKCIIGHSTVVLNSNFGIV